jgi:hypothetical protein
MGSHGLTMIQVKGRIENGNLVTLQPLTRPNSEFAPNSVSSIALFPAFFTLFYVKIYSISLFIRCGVEPKKSLIHLKFNFKP